MPDGCYLRRYPERAERRLSLARLAGGPTAVPRASGDGGFAAGGRANSPRQQKRSDLLSDRHSVSHFAPRTARLAESAIGLVPAITRSCRSARHCARLAQVPRGTSTPVVVSWIGISADEMLRMKPAREPWIETRWPLIERRISRRGCLDWMREHGYPEPPRSACTFCPFHSKAEWRRMQREDPASFTDAISFDREARALRLTSDMWQSECFIHRSLQPLDEVDLRNDVDHGQQAFGWLDECGGHCRV